MADCIAGGTIDDLKFGEFRDNFTDLIGGDCRSFASLFAKSRMSNPIESKPMISRARGSTSDRAHHEPEADEVQQPLGGATFSITPNPFTLTGSLSVTDDLAPDDNAAAGTSTSATSSPVITPCARAAPAGYIIDERPADGRRRQRSASWGRSRTASVMRSAKIDSQTKGPVWRHLTGGHRRRAVGLGPTSPTTGRR